MISRGAHPGKSFSPQPAQTIRKGYYLRLLWEFFPNIFAPIALKMLMVLNFTHLCVWKREGHSVSGGFFQLAKVARTNH
jgi:hypothetical protein